MLWLAVAIGGSIGAVMRYGIASFFMSYNIKFPVATLTANLAGSFLMGVFYVLIVERGLIPPVWRQAAMIGCFGALTTFSTFSIETLHLIQSGHWQLAFSYILLSVFGSLFAVFVGVKLVESFF